MMKLMVGTHAEVREFLLDYLDGKVPLWRALQFRLHLYLCPPCRDYLERYNTSVTLSKKILADPPPPELIDLTLDFLDQKLPVSEGRPRHTH